MIQQVNCTTKIKIEYSNMTHTQQNISLRKCKSSNIENLNKAEKGTYYIQ